MVSRQIKQDLCIKGLDIFLKCRVFGNKDMKEYSRSLMDSMLFWGDPADYIKEAVSRLINEAMKLSSEAPAWIEYTEEEQEAFLPEYTFCEICFAILTYHITQDTNRRNGSISEMHTARKKFYSEFEKLYGDFNIARIIVGKIEKAI